jgi:hypothetical protein
MKSEERPVKQMKPEIGVDPAVEGGEKTVKTGWINYSSEEMEQIRDALHQYLARLELREKEVPEALETAIEKTNEIIKRIARKEQS